MKGEDIYNGMTDIRDDQVAEAQNGLHHRAFLSRKNPQKFYKKRWMIPVTAMLAAAVTAGMFLNPWNGSLRAYAISEAEYPKQTRYSVLNTGPWYEARRERRSFSQVYAGTLGNFMTAAVPELLTEAGTENRVCSPINVYMALSMLAELTDGESREQLLKLLDCDTIETVRTRANALWNANYVDDGTVTSVPANSLWLNDGLDFIQGTMDTLSETYYASSYCGKMGTPNFDRTLQKWIDQNTQNRLKKQSSGITMDQDTVLALVSTIYYRAKWSNEFQKDQTSPDIFHAPDGDRTVGWRKTPWKSFLFLPSFQMSGMLPG